MFMKTSIVLCSYLRLIVCITIIINSYACEDYLLDLPNQPPKAQSVTDTYCTQDQLIHFTFILSDYEESPLDIELIANNQILDLSSSYSFSQGLTSDQKGLLHHFAWQKSCEASSFDLDRYQAPKWVYSCPESCTLRPNPSLKKDINQCFSQPDTIPDSLELTVILSDGDKPKEFPFSLTYAGECADL
jgi:hypothetical protein